LLKKQIYKNPTYLTRKSIKCLAKVREGDDWDFIDYINVIGVLSMVLFCILYSFLSLFVFIRWLWIKLRKNKEINSEEILRSLADA